MPYFRNNNAHGVRAGGSRIGPGQVVEVSDEDAKAYSSYDDVEKVSAQEGKDAAKERRDADNPSQDSPSKDLNEVVAKARTAARSQGIVAPLQVVVGDDDAPYGPPTGVVTTKQTEAEKGPEEKRRFADHEHVDVPEKASPIEQQQAENVREFEDLAQELAERQSGGGESDEKSDEG